MKKLFLVLFFVFISTYSAFAYEDLTTFTSNGVNTTSTRATWNGSEPAYAYKNYGSNYFTGDFVINFSYKITYASSASYTETNILFGLSDSTSADWPTLATANKGLIIGYRLASAQSYIYLINFNGDTTDVTTDAQVAVSGSQVYVTVIRSSGTVTAYFYSDANRTVLEDTLTLSCSDSFQYLSAYGIFSGWGNYSEGYTENFLIQGGDDTAPVLSNPSPSESLPAHTTETTMSIDTDENSTCKYSNSASIPYYLMTNVFSTTGGTTHSTTVTGLQTGQTATDHEYYIRCSDGALNWNTSDYNLTITVSADETAPDQIDDLSITSCDDNSCTITWTSVGDDGGITPADSYDVRYSTTEITSGNWNSSTQYTGETEPKEADETETIVVSGLAPDTTYYFAVKSKDAAENESILSNVPNDATDAISANTVIDARVSRVSDKIRPTDTVSEGTTATYKLAKNEWGAVQFAVVVDKERIDNFDISATLSDFTDVTIFYEGNVQIITPSHALGDTGEYPDIMYPKVDSYYGETRNIFPLSLSNISRAYPFMTSTGAYSYGSGLGDGPTPCGSELGCWQQNKNPDSGFIYPNNGLQTSGQHTTNHNQGDGSVTSGGVYYGTGSKRYYIVIEADGALNTTTFKWSNDGGSSWQTGIPVTDSATVIDSGITVTFSGDEDANDFYEDDEWVIYASETYNHVFWVDFKAPSNATAGNYSGTITATADGKTNKNITANITVWNFSIPSTSSLKNWFGSATWDYSKGHDGISATSGINNVYIAAGLNHKISLADSYILSNGGKAGCTCTSYNEETGEITADCSSVGTNLGPFINGTGTTYFPSGDDAVSFEGEITTFTKNGWYQYNNSFSMSYGSCSYVTEANIERDIWKAFIAYLKTNNWFDKFYVYIADEPSSSTWPTIKTGVDYWRVVDPDVKIWVTSSICAAEAQTAEDYIDIFIPEPAFTEIPNDSKKYSEILGSACRRSEYDTWLSENPNREVWNYHACIESGACSWAGGLYYTGWPNYSIDQDSSISTRMRTWFDRAFNYTGELYYAVNYGHYRYDQRNVDPFDSTYWFAVNGDGILFYPGMPTRIGGTHDIPLESLRLKIIRLSFQDYEYFYILDNNGKSSDVNTEVSKLISTSKDFVDDSALVETTREELANLILFGTIENPKITIVGFDISGFDFGQ